MICAITPGEERLIVLLAEAARGPRRDGLFALFTRTRAIRLGIVAQGQETAAPDFGRRASEADEPVP